MSDFTTSFKFTSLKRVLDRIEEETEWLSTTEGDEIQCIGIENLIGILNQELSIDIQIDSE